MPLIIKTENTEELLKEILADTTTEELNLIHAQLRCSPNTAFKAFKEREIVWRYHDKGRYFQFGDDVISDEIKFPFEAKEDVLKFFLDNAIVAENRAEIRDDLLACYQDLVVLLLRSYGERIQSIKIDLLGDLEETV
jgi:hypothetical protein